jgi:hypothetical protein
MRSTKNTRATEAAVLLAFEALYPHCTDAVATFEHGQWWVLAMDEEGDSHTWGVHDASGPPSMVADGFSFEEVS